MPHSKDLSLSDIPPKNANWEQLADFAGTINGYEMAGSSDKCSEIAASPDPKSIRELRISLFFSFRSMRHCGDEVTDIDIRHFRGIVDQIRQLVGRSDS